MSLPISGLHHVTSIASNAQENNDFFTKILGLRRVKKTVNFDSPDTYHLYYGDEKGTPGSVMTYFPFRGIGKSVIGTGEVSETHFSVPTATLGYWKERLGNRGVTSLTESTRFGQPRLSFAGPDGDGFALIEAADDHREGWTGAGVSSAEALRGFQGVNLRLRNGDATAELLRFMGYDKVESEGSVTRYGVNGGNGADFVDIDVQPNLGRGQQGAGSVHHLAFSVADRAAQLEVRKSLMDTGYQVTPVIDRDYFWAIYFRTPGGVLFEVATAEPGFDRDEDLANLGTALKLPKQHEALRAQIEEYLPPIAG
jgi:glyoxalase family protein